MLVVLLILFLVLSALFAGAEIAFLSANKFHMERRKKQGERKGTLLAGFYEKPADFLATLLLGNTLAMVTYSLLAAVILREWFHVPVEGWGLVAGIFIIALVFFFMAEWLPKLVFRLFPDRVLLLLANLLWINNLLLWPFSWLFIKIANLILRLFFHTSYERSAIVTTRLDLEDFVNNARTSEEDEIDKELFGNVLNLRDVRVRDCMVPRPEVEHIDVTASVEALELLFAETRLSRLLITEGDIDKVLGYVHHQQLLTQPTEIKSLILRIGFVPEVTRATDLLDRFIRERSNIACVVNEFGGLAGVITLEDLLEEIFGDIEDEHDEEEEYLEEQISDTEFVFSGRLEIDYLNEKYPQLHFPEGDYQTLSGYLVMTTGQIPEQGAEILLDDYLFILESASQTKIETIRVRVLNKAGQE